MKESGMVIRGLALLLLSAGAVTAADSSKTATDNPVGRKVYEAVCSVCHAKGLNQAPSLEDKAAWQARVKAGMAKLEQVALHGSGAMPAKGGKSQLSDAEVKAAVAYMVELSR